MNEPAGRQKTEEQAARYQVFSDRMLNLVELMRVFTSSASAVRSGKVTLVALSRDLLGLVRCIARVNDTALSIEVADACRECEPANLDVRLILLVILETLVRSSANADKPLKVELNCTPKPATPPLVPDLPETWLNAQLHQAVEELRDGGGELELVRHAQGMTARVFVPLKTDVALNS